MLKNFIKVKNKLMPFKKAIIFISLYVFIHLLPYIPIRKIFFPILLLQSLIIQGFSYCINLKDMPILMHNVGLGFLTLLISLAIFVFGKDNKTIYEWDKAIIFKKIFNLKKLIISLSFIFIPSFLYNHKNKSLELIYFFIFIYGSKILISIIYDIYKWVNVIEIGKSDKINGNNYRNKLRNDYLNSLSDPLEVEQVWSLTWMDQFGSSFDEFYLFKHFNLHLDLLLKSNKLEIFINCIENFIKFIPQIKINSIFIMTEIFEKTLEAYQEIINIENSENNYLKFRSKKIIKDLILYAIEENEIDIILSILYEFIMKLKSQNIQKIINSIFTILFDVTLKMENYSYKMWLDSPDNWKLTIKNFNSENNMIPRYIYSTFSQWINGKWNNKSINLNNMIIELFPEVDTKMWSKILSLMFLQPWTDRKMESLLNNTNELPSRIFSYSIKHPIENADELIDNQRKDWEHQQEQSAIKLALTLFKKQLNQINLQNYISELEELNYPKDQEKEKLRNEYIRVFQMLLEVHGNGSSVQNETDITEDLTN